MKGYRYREIDGVRNFSNSFIMSLWDKAKTKKGYRELYPDSYTREDFLKSCRFGNFHLWVFFEGDNLFCMIRVANLRPKRAELHFCIFDKTDMVRYGKLATATIMEYYGLDIVYGYIANTNKKALQYVNKIGWKEAGILPMGSFIFPENKSVDSVIVCYGGENEDL